MLFVYVFLFSPPTFLLSLFGLFCFCYLKIFLGGLKRRGEREGSIGGREEKISYLPRPHVSLWRTARVGRGAGKGTTAALLARVVAAADAMPIELGLAVGARRVKHVGRRG